MILNIRTAYQDLVGDVLDCLLCEGQFESNFATGDNDNLQWELQIEINFEDDR